MHIFPKNQSEKTFSLALFLGELSFPCYLRHVVSAKQKVKLEIETISEAKQVH